MQSKTDACLYINSSKENVIYVIVHVDDFLVVSKSMEKINETAYCLNKSSIWWIWVFCSATLALK